MSTRVVFDCKFGLDLTREETYNRTKSDEVNLIKIHIFWNWLNIYSKILYNTNHTSKRLSHSNFKEKIIQEKKIEILSLSLHIPDFWKLASILCWNIFLHFITNDLSHSTCYLIIINTKVAEFLWNLNFGKFLEDYKKIVWATVTHSTHHAIVTHFKLDEIST